MDNIMEIAIDLGPQKHIWTTPFWFHIRPTGPTDLWHEIYEHQFHDWNTLLAMVNKYRKYLIEDSNRPFSWEEREAPEILPRTLVDTTIQELVRLLPPPFRRVPKDRLVRPLWGIPHHPRPHSSDP